MPTEADLHVRSRPTLQPRWDCDKQPGDGRDPCSRYSTHPRHRRQIGHLPGSEEVVDPVGQRKLAGRTGGPVPPVVLCDCSKRCFQFRPTVPKSQIERDRIHDRQTARYAVFLPVMWKKWLFGVSVAAVGGIAAGIALKWTPLVAVWYGLKAGGTATWSAVSFKVAFPLSLLIVLVVPYIALGVVLTRQRRPRNEETLSALPGSMPQPITIEDPTRQYESDEILGVLWVWRWVNRRHRIRSPEDIRPLCPRRSCRSDLSFEPAYGCYLHCMRCEFQLSVGKHDILITIEREIVSRTRTGDWQNASERLRRLDESNP